SPAGCRTRCCRGCLRRPKRAASRCWTMSGPAARNTTTTGSSSTGSTWTPNTVCRISPACCSGSWPKEETRMGLDFLILYEHVVREYESILLLKLELERRGYTVAIQQLLDRKKLAYRTWNKPKVLVSSCMYDDEAINSHVY